MMIVRRDSFGPLGYILVSVLFVATVISGIIVGALSVYSPSYFVLWHYFDCAQVPTNT
jgi:hypothetical protein